MGTHRNDVGPLPATPVEVCPGLFGGALTPMAYADGRVFVPVVELCMQESAVETARVAQRPAEEGTGVIAALDAAKREAAVDAEPSVRAVRLRHGGVRRGLHADLRRLDLCALGRDAGAILWKDRARAGINGCPSVAGDTLLVPAGAPHTDFAAPVPQLIAYRLAPSQ